MAFPASPTNGQTATINNVGYVYNSTKGAWVKSGALSASSPVASVAGRTGAVTLTYADISSGTPPTFPWTTQITGQAALNTTTPGLGNFGLHFTGQTTVDNAAGITWNGGTGTTGAQAGIYVQGSGSYGTKMYLATTDNYSTGSKTAISIDHTGAVSVTRGSLSVFGATTLSSTLAVTGASTFNGGLSATTGSFSSTLNAPYIGVNNTTGSNGYGISLYGGGSASQPTYGIMFQQTATFGTYGTVSGDWATYLTMNNSAGRGWIFRDTTNGNKASISNTGDLNLAGALGVGTSASGTTGEIRATNAITAYYSDRRLKTEVSKIENALDKIDQLCGVIYTQNKKAEEFGYNNYEEQVGVYAQDVQKVQPQAVKPAPFDIAEDGSSKSGENYLTVQYEKLVPLLVEGIKELREEIRKLKGE